MRLTAVDIDQEMRKVRVIPV